MKIKPRHIVIALTAAAAVLFLRYVVFPPKFLPGQFLEARLKGASIAERIVELSRLNLSRLEEVSQYDRDRNYTQALLAISKAVIENRDGQTEAIRLSSQLAAMAEFLPKIQPAKARQLATEAVTADVALVSRLLYYNNYMNELFEKLKVKFEKPWVAYLDGQVDDLINKINDEAQEINELNKKFARAMAEMDLIFSGHPDIQQLQNSK